MFFGGVCRHEPLTLMLNFPSCEIVCVCVCVFPGFLVYMALVLVLCAVLVLYLSPRVGRSNILVYVSICSLLGAFTVSSVKGLAIAINTGERVCVKCQ